MNKRSSSVRQERRSHYLGILIFFSLLSVACSPQPEFSENIELPASGWTHDDTVEYKVDVQDTSAVYQLELVIDHSASYRYQNIYLDITTGFPDREDRKEKLTIDLADKMGSWKGNCQRENCKLKVYLLEEFKFPAQGEYSFAFNQYTREESLVGINELELELYKID